MPPNLEDAARRLNQEPVGQDIKDIFARRMAEGVNLQPLLEQLNERTVQVGKIMDQINALSETMQSLQESVEEVDRQQAEDIANKVNELNQRAAEERQKIQQITNQAPDLPLIQQRHWQDIRRRDISRDVENLPPQELASAFQQEFPRGERYSDVFRNYDNPEQLFGSMKQGLTQQRLQEQNTPLDVFGPLGASEGAAQRILNIPDEILSEYDTTTNVSETPADNIPPDPPGPDNTRFVSDDGIPHVIVDDVLLILGKTQLPSGGNQQTQQQDNANTGPGPGPAGADTTVGPGMAAAAAGAGAGAGAGGAAAGQDMGGNIGRGFGLEHLMGAGRVIEDITTPGGASTARMGQGLLGSAASGAAFLGAGMPVIAPLAVAGLVGGAGLAQAEQMRSIERQFGENQTMWTGEGGGNQLRGAQVESRLTHPLLGSEEIENLSSELARLGATAEEAAEALGPASDALAQYRVLNEETAARAARRGQQFSEVGAAEAGILGRVMEQLSGGGFAADTLNQAAQTSANVFEPMGGTQADISGLGIANLLQSGGSQTDMILETSGTANKSIEFGGQVLSEPWRLGPAANMYGGGDIDYTQIDPTTTEGQAQSNFMLTDIVSTTAERYGIRPDPETGKIEPGNAENRRQASMMADELSAALGVSLEEGEILAMLETVNQAGGAEKAYEQTLGPMQMAERDRKRVQEEIGGSLAEEAQGTLRQDLGSRWGGNVAGILNGLNPIPGFKPLSSVIEGAGMGLANTITGKSAIQRGEAGGFASADEWRQSEGFASTIMGIEGQGMFDRGIDPSQVNVVGPKGGEFTLSEVIKDKDLQKRFNQGELLAEVDVGGKTQRMTAEEMATAAYNDELKMDTGRFGIGKGKGLTMGEESGTKGGRVEVAFTGSAEKFFRQVDAKDPGTMAGSANQAINSDKADRGQIAPYDVMPPYGG